MKKLVSFIVVFLLTVSQIGFADELLNSPSSKKQIRTKTTKSVATYAQAENDKKGYARIEKKKIQTAEKSSQPSAQNTVSAESTPIDQASKEDKGPSRKIMKRTQLESVDSAQNLGSFVGTGKRNIWRIMPGFEFKTLYDTNVNRESPHHRDEDIILNYTPSVDIKRSGSRYAFQTGYEMNFQEFLIESEQNSFNHLFSTKFNYSGERLQVKLDESFSIVKTYASSEQDQRRIVMLNDINPEVIYKLTPKFSVSSLYRNRLVSYKDSNQKEFSFDTNTTGGRFYYHATPKLDMFLEGTGFSTNYYNSGLYDSDGYSIMTGATGRLTRKFLTSFQTGFRGTRYDDPRINGYYDWVLEGAFQYRATPKSTITLLGKRDKEESLYRNVSWYRSNYFGLIYNYKISRRISFVSENNIRENAYPVETTERARTKKRKDIILETSAKLSWNPVANLVLSIGYGLRERFSNFDSTFDYLAHAVDTSVSYQFA